MSTKHGAKSMSKKHKATTKKLGSVVEVVVVEVAVSWDREIESGQQQTELCLVGPASWGKK
jgi:hypothetical protein